MRALALAATLLILALPAWAQDITGLARVIDGDTIDVAGERIRLHGIDTPESRQTCGLDGRDVRCGKAATAALRRLIDNEPVSCQERDVDQYGRIVAVCFNAEGKDVGAELVREGWALAYRQYSVDYVDEEQEAKAGKAGLWSMDFVAPWDWRRGVRLVAGPANDNATGQCQIKGNISSRGERIYHVPGGASYGRTKISPSKGERFFCSEVEAEAAGWIAKALEVDVGYFFEGIEGRAKWKAKPRKRPTAAKDVRRKGRSARR